MPYAMLGKRAQKLRSIFIMHCSVGARLDTRGGSSEATVLGVGRSDYAV